MVCKQVMTETHFEVPTVCCLRLACSLAAKPASLEIHFQRDCRLAFWCILEAFARLDEVLSLRQEVDVLIAVLVLWQSLQSRSLSGQSAALPCSLWPLC